MKLKRLLKHLFLPHRGNAFRPHALRHKALSFYSLGLLFAQLLFGATIYSGPVIMSGDAKTVAKNIITLTNDQRKSVGAGELYENETLNKAAEDKLRDMFDNDYWDHTGPKGQTAWDFIGLEGYRYLLAGENLARGFEKSNDVVQAWMNSPTHRENLLNSKFQEIGIAIGSGRIKGNKTTVIVQLFGQPRTAFAASSASGQQQILGNQRLYPEFSVNNTTMPSKAPYLVVWTFIFCLVVLDGVMIRRLGLHCSRSHMFNFRVSLLMSVLAFALLAVGVVGIA
jgi:uncharacterized protein YkwD